MLLIEVVLGIDVLESFMISIESKLLVYKIVDLTFIYYGIKLKVISKVFKLKHHSSLR